MSDLNEQEFMVLGSETSDEDDDLLVGGDEELEGTKPATKPKKEGEEGWEIEEDLEEGLE